MFCLKKVQVELAYLSPFFFFYSKLFKYNTSLYLRLFKERESLIIDKLLSAIFGDIELILYTMMDFNFFQMTLKTVG